MSKVVAIHQPEHLPYPGFIGKILKSDLFVILDHVPYRRRYYQNRNKIITREGNEQWLILPIKKAAFDAPINSIIISDDHKWQRDYLGRLEDAYKKTNNYLDFSPFIRRTILGKEKNLCKINIDIIYFLLFDIFDYRGKVVRSSELNLKSSKSDLMLEISKKTSSDTYLSGTSGRDYLRIESFSNSNIKLQFLDYNPFEFTKSVSPYLSVLDPLMRYDRNYVKEKILSNSIIS
tara:strand:- start:1880 stop:2578 length:699 start_codon:yes stop_codon:yes gene_type:complete